MSWLKIEHDLPDKPEPFQMAGILGIEPDAVVGKLLRVWIWADKHTSIDDTGDGYASVTVLPLLNRIAGVTDFTDAMIKAGWLVVDGEILRFPHLGRHNGKTAKDRALSACRMAEHRARKENGCASVAPPLRPERNNSVTREEKRREEKSIATEQQGAVAPAAGAASLAPELALTTEPAKPKAPRTRQPKFDAATLPLPPPLDTPAYRRAFESWCRYLVQRPKPCPMCEEQAKHFLAKWAELGEARAIAAIKHTIEMGWQGCREPDAPAAGGNGQPKLDKDGLLPMAPPGVPPGPGQRWHRNGSLPYLQIAGEAERKAMAAEDEITQANLDNFKRGDRLIEKMDPAKWATMKDARAAEYAELLARFNAQQAKKGANP